MASIDMETVLVRSNDLLASDLDNETVMMDIERGDYYGLDAVGSRVWALLEEPKSLGDLVSALTEEFEVSPEQCETDVRVLLDQLLERRIVLEEQNSQPA